MLDGDITCNHRTVNATLGHDLITGNRDRRHLVNKPSRVIPSLHRHMHLPNPRVPGCMNPATTATTTCSAGAQGLMQFMPGTWGSTGVDGDADGNADISNDADASTPPPATSPSPGVRAGAAAVRRALFARLGAAARLRCLKLA